jgi:hypothetical protein
MDLYEQLIEMNLTIFERLAVVPQFPVLFDENDEPWTSGHKVKWSAYPDFLALDVQNKLAYVVEVSKSLQSSKPHDLAKRMIKDRPKIDRYVNLFAEGFDVRWRFFVRGDQVKALRSALAGQTPEPGIDTIESVFDKIRSEMP